MRLAISAILLLLSFQAFSASWTPETGSKVGVINPGARSEGATFFSLDNVTFSGCTKTNGAFLWKEGNNNYSEIYSLLLAAKMGDKLVRIYYDSPDGCSYPDIIQAYIL